MLNSNMNYSNMTQETAMTNELKVCIETKNLNFYIQNSRLNILSLKFRSY